MRYPAIMVDLETMGTSTDAAILAIGACYFDYGAMSTPEELRAQSYGCTISLPSNVKEGRTIDAATVVWWLQQPKEAQERLYSGIQIPIRKALGDFLHWIRTLPIEPRRVWAKDPDFDCKMLEHACTQLDFSWPFRYYQSRSVRTAVELAFPEERPEITVGVKHDATDDAIQQALLVQMARRQVRENVEKEYTEQAA